MSQRNSAIKTPQPTSLRRSPRLLLQLKHSPQTPNLTSSRKPDNGSTNSAKSSVRGEGFDNGCVNYPNSANGYGHCAKSANGSRRKPNLGSGFCKDVVSLVDVNVVCDTRSRSKSNVTSLTEIDSLAPVTPVEVGQKKCRGFLGSGMSGASGSIVLSLGDSERRVTRSCSRKMGENVVGRTVRNVNLKDIGVFDGCVGGIELRRCERRVLGAIGDRRSLVCGLGRVGCDSGSQLSCERLGDRRSLVCGLGRVRCEGLGGSFERRITRSAMKSVGKGSDLCGGDTERGRTGVSSSSVSGKGGSRKAKGKKQEFHRCERGRKVKQASIVPVCATLEVEEAEVVRGIGVKEKEFLEGGKKDGGKLINVSSDVSQGGKLIGVKRKRQERGCQGRELGWSNEQEVALQRAYFAAKPSPHFWKTVSKMVPGKSAQECFDKVHSANLTPLSTRRSSRMKKQNSPSELLLSGDKLLKTIPTKTKRQCKTKRKSHVARKNVRHLLQKYCQDNKADLFSILEPSGNPLAENLKLKAAQLTPGQASGSPGSSSKCRTMSSSGLKKRLSRFSSASKSPLTSPPVLKRVKNLALHEKYIDQLHVRNGKRKVVSSRYSKSVQCHKDGAQNSAQRKVAIKTAKEALVSDAKDAIEKFRLSQTNLMEVYSDSEDARHSDNDEDDVFL
ncbi:hypothetical protein vseg_019515 [Gypsophila vaccaria]